MSKFKVGDTLVDKEDTNGEYPRVILFEHEEEGQQEKFFLVSGVVGSNCKVPYAQSERYFELFYRKLEDES